MYKRKREELESDARIIKRNTKSELRILKYQFKILDKKYYYCDEDNNYLITHYIESKQIDTLTINFDLRESDFLFQIPSRIKILRLMNGFNYPIDNLPDTIIQLEISGKFNHPINKLPTNLTHLIIDSQMQNQITNFPTNLLHLELPRCKINVDNLPVNLIHLKVNSVDSLDNLPEKITHLTVHANIPVDNLPESIRYLTLENFNLTVNNLPRGVKKITFGSGFNKSVDNLPVELEDLDLGYNFNQLVDNLPPNLKSLRLGPRFNKKITSLPNSIEYISFDSPYPFSLDCLPNTIKIIEFSLFNYGWTYDFNNYVNEQGQLQEVLPRIGYNPNLTISPIIWKPAIEKIVFYNIGLISNPVDIKFIFGDKSIVIKLVKEFDSTDDIEYNGHIINIKCNYINNITNKYFVLKFKIKKH